MKKLLAGIAAFSVCLTSPGITHAQQIQITEFKHQNNRHYHQTLNPGGEAYFKYQIPANTIGVFTLKNQSRRANFDIYIYNSSGKQLNQGKNSGVRTELVTTPMVPSNQYAYISIVNYGSQPSEYHFYANYVSPANRFGIALIENSLTCRQEVENNRNRASSRVVTGMSSILQGNNLAGLGQNLLINEVTNEIRNQLGYGCVADFFVNWGVSMVSGIYRNYP